jgi:protein involved in polysaccharide export with SLBB domain
MPRLAALAFLALAAFGAQAQYAQPPLPLPGSAAPAPTAPAPAPSAPVDTSAPVFPAAAPPVAPAPAPVAPPAATAATPAPAPAPGQVRSDVFGANLFTGAFTASAPSVFNPDQVVSIGDLLQVRLWGAFQFDGTLTVDAQGNIFVPQVGPVMVKGVTNRDLPRVLEEAMRRTFRANVYSYISLAAAQPVRVFVTGFVQRPGMYPGTSFDSVLRFVDQAGGIDPERGSFLDVQVLRHGAERARFNLYDFILTGKIASVQFADGDTIVVGARRSMFKVSGLADNPNRFEFEAAQVPLEQLVRLARPQPAVTNVRVYRNSGVVRHTEYYALSEVSSVSLQNGDEVQFTADKRPGTISVRVQGEHVSPQEYALPYGARVGELIKRIQLTERSDADNLQLFRVSVKERQKKLLQASLTSFENSVLTARSGTGEEAQLRREEAALMLQWVERARKQVDPLGQVVIARAPDRDQLLLEDGDVIQVPSRNGLVLVHGEVIFPNAVAFDARYRVEDYIQRSGGYTQNADESRIIVAHRDGSFDQARLSTAVHEGDDVLVLPKVDTKARQFAKDITQIIFQIAVVAKIAFGL